MTDVGVPAYVLAGGRSSRFGSDKARAEVNGLPLIQHVVRALQPLVSSVTVVAAVDGHYDDLGLPTIGDLRPDLGPVGGLATALAHNAAQGGASPWLLMAPCDVLGLRRAWLEQLLAHPRKGHHAVAFRGDRWEPLPGLYHLDARSVVDAAISEERLSLWRMVERCLPAAPTPPADWDTQRKVNRPGDLEGLERERQR